MAKSQPAAGGRKETAMTEVFLRIELLNHLPRISFTRVSGTGSRSKDRLWFCSPHLVLPVSRWFRVRWLDRLNAAQAGLIKTRPGKFC